MAWDRPKIEVVLGLLHQGNVTMEWALAFSQLYTQLNATGRRFYISYSRGAPWDIARNHCVDDTLRLGSEWLLFIDSDVIVTPDLYDRLQARNLPIVSALYFRRHKPITPAAWRLVPETGICSVCGQPFKPREKGKYNPIVEYTRGDLVEADVVGSGALLIHRRVLEAVHHPPEEPMFIWTAGREATLKPHILEHFVEGPGVSEDFAGCERVRKAGFRIFCDTSVLLPHYGEVKFTAPEKTDVDSIKYGGIEFPTL